MPNMSILLGKSLRAAREQLGLTQTEVGDKLDVSRTAVGQWESGKTEPSTQHLLDACALLRIDVAAATGGLVKKISMEEFFPGENQPAVISDRRPEFRHIEDEAIRSLGSRANQPADVPVRGVAAGGADADFYTNGETVDFVRRPAGIASFKQVYALYVVGNSMEPRYNEGEIIYVNPTRLPAINDYVVIELKPDEGDRVGRGYVKKLIRRSASKIVCEQFNPRKTLEFATAEVKEMHRVMPWNEVVGV